MIPVMAKPIIPAEPTAPDLAAQLPKTVTLTPKEVAYYKEACDAWEGGEYSGPEMQDAYPGLTRGAACDWAIKGYTIQDGLTVEDMWNQSARYAEEMRNYARALKQQIEHMYQLSQETQKAIKETNFSRANNDKKESSWTFRD